MTRWIWVVCVAASAAWSAGCVNNQQTVDTSGGAYREVTSPASELVASGRPVIPDVPIPVGFDMDEGRSRGFTAGGARYIDHVYKGRSEKFAVGRFYRRQMPIARWVLVTDMFVQGDLVLDFEKDTERCRIIVTSGSWFHPTVIKVQLWTTGRIEPVEGKGAAKR